jgi:hypothetical protein
LIRIEEVVKEGIMWWDRPKKSNWFGAAKLDVVGCKSWVAT